MWSVWLAAPRPVELCDHTSDDRMKELEPPGWSHLKLLQKEPSADSVRRDYRAVFSTFHRIMWWGPQSLQSPLKAPQVPLRCIMNSKECMTEGDPMRKKVRQTCNFARFVAVLWLLATFRKWGDLSQSDSKTRVLHPKFSVSSDGFILQYIFL